MVQSGARSVEEYLAELPAERRHVLESVRESILRALPDGFEETIQWGMIAYVIPLDRYPDTYNGQPLFIAALAAQKRHYSVYLHSIYGDPALREEFERRYRATGKRMDVGKSCVRFRDLEDLPLELISWAVRTVGVDQYVARYEASRAG